MHSKAPTVAHDAGLHITWRAQQVFSVAVQRQKNTMSERMLYSLPVKQ